MLLMTTATIMIVVQAFTDLSVFINKYFHQIVQYLQRLEYDVIF